MVCGTTPGADPVEQQSEARADESGQPEEAARAGPGGEQAGGAAERDRLFARPAEADRAVEPADVAAARRRPPVEPDVPVGGREQPVLPARGDRHAGEPRVALPQRQPQPAQPAVRAGAVLQSADHEHWKLPAVADPRRDRRRRALPSDPVPQDARTLSLHVNHPTNTVTSLL